MSVFQKLKSIAELHGFEIIDCEDKLYSKILIGQKTISVPVKDNINVAPLLAHELGHFMFANSMPEKEFLKYVLSRFYFYNGPLRLKDLLNVQMEERAAWKIGKKLLKDCGYKDWKRFEKVRSFNLDSYNIPIRFYEGIEFNVRKSYS